MAWDLFKLIIIIFNGNSMKKALFLVFTIVTASLSWADAEEAIGKERIKPLDYPKVSFSFEYDALRKMQTFGEKGSTSDLGEQHGYWLSFEASLYKYMNAGAAFSLNLPIVPTDPTNSRLTLFAKPFIPLHERFAVFARVGGGIGGMFAGLLAGATGHALGSVGVEYFPFSRLGIAVEYGLRTELIRAKSIMDRSGSDPIMLLFYETPVALSMLIIL